MIRDIVMWPDNRLHDVSAAIPFEEMDTDPTNRDDLKAHIQDMYDTLYDVGGVGLASIQIGVAFRIFIIDCGRAMTMINPVIEGSFGKLERKNEGCLSLPGIIEMIDRYPEVQVSYYDIEGVKHEERFKALEAHCIQHEMDHLNGRIIPDYLGPAERAMLASRIKKRKKRSEKP